MSRAYSMTLLLVLLQAVLATPPLYARQLTVLAASSLTEALTAVASDYHNHYPDEQITLSFAGSQSLATQIELGAAVDLFISANLSVMQRLQQQQLVQQSQPLVGNRLVLAVRHDLQPPVTDLTDLARDNLLLTIGNPQTPIGHYTRQLLNRLAALPGYGTTLIHQIEHNVVSQENQVKAIVAKLVLGEADAGIIYQSDLNIGNAEVLRAITLPHPHCPQAIYPMAKTHDSGPGTDQFCAYLHGEHAQHIFRQHGFMPLDPP